MDNNISRILVETVVKNTLKEIKDAPERSIRNLVDMALHFSEGRFQHHFFQIAQTMLQNEQSPYYALVKDVVAHVETDRLLRFGMNLGYNSCTIGARTIRDNEARYGCNIPWAVSLCLRQTETQQAQQKPQKTDGQPADLDMQKHIQPKQQKHTAQPEAYDSVIAQGEQLGIYTWMLFGDGWLKASLPLMQAHPGSAFLLFCQPADLTPSFLRSLSNIKNSMLVVRYEEEHTAVFDLLRKQALLYSTFRFYTDTDVNAITSGNWFEKAEQVHPVFTALVPMPSCTRCAYETVAAYIEAVRKEQRFCTLAWEFCSDSRFVDSIISDDACFAAFDANGDLYTPDASKTEACGNLFQNDLLDIFRHAFVKRPMMLHPTYKNDACKE